MAGRVSQQLIAGLFWLLCFGQAMAEKEITILVGYSLDDDNISAGPDTFQIFQNGKGTVSLDESYRYSGYRSIRFNDIPNDNDFPELQGYFNAIEQDVIYFHFVLMTTDANESFNIALAGKKGFSLEKNGIGFWLFNDNGLLRHYSDGIPKKLFQLQSFLWYLVDVSYNLKDGRYDLSIETEYGKTLTRLTAVINASNNPQSEINMFSFIGDLKDSQAAEFYVDDIVVSANRPINKSEFAAPGRKKLFVDIWHDY